MKQYITGSRVANKVLMLQSAEKKAAVIVEGITDKRFYGKFIDRQTAVIVVADGRSNVLKAVAILEKRGAKGYFAIVDADFSRLEGKQEAGPNVFLTDTHDVESMIIKSPALENVLAEYADREELVRFEESIGDSLRGVLAKSAAVIGSLRWLSLRDGFYFSFRGLSFSRFTDENTLTVDVEKLVEAAIGNSQHSSQFLPAKVEAKLQTLQEKSYDPWQICNGHDLSELLLLGLRHIFGASNSRHLNHGELEGSLRLAYELLHFIETDLYQLIREWEEGNSTRVLRGEFLLDDQVAS